MPATVAASLIRALLDYLQAQGLDRSRLLEHVGLEPTALVSPQRSIEAVYYERLLAEGMARLHNPLLGLEFGMAAEPARWGRLGFLLRHCATLGEALSYQARFAHLVNAIGEGRLLQRANDVVIEWHSSRRVMPAVIEEAFAAWLGFARWARGENESPQSVEFSHRAQGDPAIYRRFFNCEVRFDRDACRICFDPALLALPLRRGDSELTAHIRAEFDQSLRRAASLDTLQALNAWLQTQIGSPPPTLGEAAIALALNERTLQHRLQLENTTFRRSLDEARHTLALRHIADAGLCIGDISHRLGFSEQSAFQRAFKRWTGITPLAWRRRHCRRSAPAYAGG
ncbi:AraC family transcriptional regulator [Salinisphaera sp. C84B14]|uniref:AraC family transcriptional regulator n=1 Tax=Salinisphaera sp. C84B14 TaxID=1304155 RepID=UPI00333EE330